MPDHSTPARCASQGIEVGSSIGWILYVAARQADMRVEVTFLLNIILEDFLLSGCDSLLLGAKWL
jgi:hypothetical protein